MPRGDEFWKLFCLTWGKWLNLGNEEFALRTRDRKLYRLTIKWTSSKSTFQWLFQVYCITQKNISEYVYKTFLEEMAFSCRRIIAACNVSKNVVPQLVFFSTTLHEQIQNNFHTFQRHFLPVHFNKLLCTFQIHACFYVSVFFRLHQICINQNHNIIFFIYYCHIFGIFNPIFR